MEYFAKLAEYLEILVGEGKKVDFLLRDTFSPFCLEVSD